ncbi:Sensory transduction protein kinase [Roseomonas mucosa]|uniref:histidine kinase n=1 Tax=Roseomonas mucosa TaxID=207340 RepID=A0A1S8D9Q6_9PROT|nr:hybrid sensor histidine kinase/response regulator [Roseomonas sp. FDAARGOS_362]ONH85113.1 hybrid sensor histidine kinase/response regulator [Roseomonas mucosa]UZO96644.1 Sensory transduction protein kinase [Roseomonas mucosa]GAV33539.1 blue-light-activated protein [Roseomonas sp. TAS13]
MGCWPFLAGGGEMGARMRDHDWAATPLGPPDTWPQSLRSTLSACLNSPLLGTILWGPDLRMLYNDSYIPSLADRHPAALGRPVAEVWGAVWERVSPPFHEAMATGRGFSQENVELPMIRRGRAETTHWFFTATPIRGEDGRIAGLLNQGIEITERVLTERRAMEEQERLSRLFEQAPTFMALLQGPEHRFALANPSYRAIVGQREILGKTVAEALPDAVAQGYLVLLDQVYRSGEPFVATGSRFAVEPVPGGPVDERYVDFVYQPIRDASGQVNGIFVEGADVTARARADLALRESEARLKELNATLEQRVEQRTRERNRLWQLSSDIMAVMRPDTVIEAVNPAWTACLGWSEAELIGRRLPDLLQPEDAGAMVGDFARIQASGRLLPGNSRCRHRDGGHRWISWSATARDDVVVFVGRDVTAEREQAEALKLAEEQLRQAQKMEAVGQLTGGLAHDFNNLLTGIIGSLELMNSRVAKGRAGEVGRYTGAALDAARRAAALTHRLLAFSRRQTLDPRPTDVNRLVTGMEELIRRTMGPDITIVVVPAPALWTTLVDPPQLENALLNLCINARDAMPEGGTLRIATENATLGNEAARELSLPPGRYIRLNVSDDGTGMPPEVVAKAFDPFFTTKPLGMGTGLGLSMIYGFARQSGGQVSIRSEPGRGTSVRLFLPRHASSAEAPEPRPPLAMPRGGAGEVVLVVDDEPSVRMLVAELLEEQGYEVLQAAEGTTGLDILQSTRRIDLLVTDVGLPGGMNGRQMADAARIARPDLKVLFITGYAEAAVVGEGNLAPGMHIMTKPFDIAALTARIRDLLAGP